MSKIIKKIIFTIIVEGYALIFSFFCPQIVFGMEDNKEVTFMEGCAFEKGYTFGTSPHRCYYRSEDEGDDLKKCLHTSCGKIHIHGGDELLILGDYHPEIKFTQIPKKYLGHVKKIIFKGELSFSPWQLGLSKGFSENCNIENVDFSGIEEMDKELEIDLVDKTGVDYENLIRAMKVFKEKYGKYPIVFMRQLIELPSIGISRRGEPAVYEPR